MDYRRFNEGLVQAMDVDTTVVQPAAEPPLFTLCLHPSTGHIGQPARQVDFPALQQGHYHPQAGRQMATLRPGNGLTQPGVQGIVEGGVFFTASTLLSGI